MGREKIWLAAAAWAAIAVLMPMAALEPVPAVAGTPAPVVAATGCADGGVQLLLGCDSIHL